MIFSLCVLKGVGVGCALGWVTNHIKAFKPHLLRNEGNFLQKAGKNTVLYVAD